MLLNVIIYIYIWNVIQFVIPPRNYDVGQQE